MKYANLYKIRVEVNINLRHAAFEPNNPHRNNDARKQVATVHKNLLYTCYYAVNKTVSDCVEKEIGINQIKLTLKENI